MAKFPKTLFVKTEKDGSTKYFVADANAACLVEMGDKIAIATYQLVGVRAAEGVVLWLSEVLASRGSSQPMPDEGQKR